MTGIIRAFSAHLLYISHFSIITFTILFLLWPSTLLFVWLFVYFRVPNTGGVSYCLDYVEDIYDDYLSSLSVAFSNLNPNPMYVVVVVVVVFFTLTDRASTIPSNILRGCQSGTWSAGQKEIRGTSTKLQ